MKSQVIKRSIVIAGHKTSVSLEDAFWTGAQGDRHRPRQDIVGPRRRDRYRTPTRQSVVGHQAVRSRPLPGENQRSCCREQRPKAADGHARGSDISSAAAIKDQTAVRRLRGCGLGWLRRGPRFVCRCRTDEAGWHQGVEGPFCNEKRNPRRSPFAACVSVFALDVSATGMPIDVSQSAFAAELSRCKQFSKRFDRHGGREREIKRRLEDFPCRRPTIVGRLCHFRNTFF